MIDPASAISLASSVVQLTTFIADLISRSQELHKSATGLLVRQSDLETTTNSLHNLVGDLSSRASKLQTESPSGTSDYDLYNLCNSCVAVADELLQATEKLKVRGRHKGWNSFRQALLSLWNEKKLDELKDRLNGFRDQINTILLLNLRCVHLFLLLYNIFRLITNSTARLSVEDLHERHEAYVKEQRKNDSENDQSFKKFIFSDMMGRGKSWAPEVLHSLYRNHWHEDKTQHVSY